MLLDFSVAIATFLLYNTFIKEVLFMNYNFDVTQFITDFRANCTKFYEKNFIGL